MHDPRFTRLVRILTEGCTRAGAYERLYADIQPRRQGLGTTRQMRRPESQWWRYSVRKTPGHCLFVPSLLMEE
jgi:hypothetical protein